MNEDRSIIGLKLENPYFKKYTSFQNEIFEYGLSGEAFMTYSYLLHYCYNQNNTAYPSIGTIAKGLNKSYRSVIRYIKELEDKGVIRRQHRYKDGLKTSNIYIMTDLESHIAEKKKSAIISESEAAPSDRIDTSENTGFSDDRCDKIVTTENNRCVNSVTSESEKNPENPDMTKLTHSEEKMTNLSHKEGLDWIGLDWTEQTNIAFAKVFTEMGIDPYSKGAEQLRAITLEENGTADQLATAIELINEQIDKGVEIRSRFGWLRNKIREIVAQDELFKNRPPVKSKKKPKKTPSVRPSNKPKYGKYEDFYLS